MTDRVSALLAWMSHLGQGSKNRFDRAAASLMLGHSEDEQKRFRRLAWRRMAELGHVCITGGKEWRIEPPTLSLLPSEAAAVWRGGRVQTWVQDMQESAEALGCVVAYTHCSGGPPRLMVSGELSALRGLAATVGAEFETKAALRLLAAMPSFETLLKNAPPALPPTTGTIDYFDYEHLAWVAAGPQSAARRYMHPNLVAQHFVETATERFLHATEAEAIHFGAAVEGLMLWHYNATMQKLAADWTLPVEFSRPLCLCSGLPAQIDGARRIYSDAPPGVSLLLHRALGGDPNRVRWFSE